jgi:uncharacterized protein (TIGR04141 family)
VPEETLGLTVFLLKKDHVSSFDKKFPPTAPDALPLADGSVGRVIPLPSTPNTPRWVASLRSLVRDSAGLALMSQSAAALMVLERGGRTYVVTFGHAWLQLDDEWVERDFGRRVALNLIDSAGLVELRAEQVFAKWHLASDRAPRATTVDEFGVEFDRDLVAAVEGRPRKAEHGKIVRGGTSLRLKIPLASLDSFLEKAESWFKSAAYKKKWPDIDNLAPVKDRATIDKLENQLDKDLGTTAGQKRIVLFTPTQRREETLAASSYVFGRLIESAPRKPYLNLPFWLTFLDAQGKPPSVAEAKRSAVHLLNDDGDEARNHTVFECFGYEVSVSNRQYILSSGVWYEATEEFVQRINQSISTIALPPVTLPKWNQVETEAAYNARCCKTTGLLLFDAKNIGFGGGQSKFEFCDVLHPKSKTMIFAKIVSRSSGMSHLVEQVRRTSELVFAPDGACRAKLRAVFNKHHPKADAAWLTSRPRAEDWGLCMLSLGPSAKDLPFFAKCSLVKVHRELTKRGHPVYFGAV